MVDRVGQQLGNYRLVRLLGEGGFAEVYLAEHIYLKTQAAIKILHARLVQNDLQNFLSEAQTIARLRHPHIVQVLDFGVEGGTPYLVMDYAPNGTLRTRLPRGAPLAPAAILPFVRGIADALQYAHDQKLIHHDIKPENMLLGRNNEVLLSDFGIATIAQTTSKQRTEGFSGTAAYAAPEQLHGKPTQASDQYALAVVTYEWLAGDTPFHGSSLAIATQHVLTPPPPLRDKVPGFSPMVEQVVLTALSKDPKERFGSVRAFATAFEQASQASPDARAGNAQIFAPLPTPEEASVYFAPTQPTPPNPRALTPPQLEKTTSASPPNGPPPEEYPGQRISGDHPPLLTEATGSPTIPAPVPPKRLGKTLLLVLLVLVVLTGSGFAFWAYTHGSVASPTSTTGGQPTSSVSRHPTASPTSPPIPTVQVGLVTDIGGLNDRGFNQLAHMGYEQAEQEVNFKDSIIQTQSTNDYTQNLTLAAQSNDLVIGVGFLMAQAMDQVAKLFPNKKFALVDACATSDASGDCDTSIHNVTPLFFQVQEAGCLVGVVAGKMELDGKAEAPRLLGANTIGAVGGVSIPQVDRYIAGYKYCAQRVDPHVNVVITYSNDFSDPSKCQNPADAMIKQQMADIIFQVAGGCGIGALDAAETDGVFGIGVDTDQSYLHPDSVITSAEKRVDVAVYTIIKDTEQGQYPADPLSFPQFDLANGGVGNAPLSAAVPADVQPVLNQYIAEIKSGQLTPPETIPQG